MRIGILTYDRVHNHGAVLQANALRLFLENQGHEVSFLMFDRNYDHIPQENVRKYKRSPASIPYYFRYLLAKGIGNILYNFRKTQILDQYRRTHLSAGKRFDEFDGDLVILGSDEVFSLEIGYNPCLYGIGVTSPKIISYGASFGPTTIEDIEVRGLCEKITGGLNSLSAISVRDIHSQEMVKHLTGKDAVLVSDPVILYGYESEMNRFTPKDQNYIVIYSYDRSMQDETEIAEIRAFAERRHRNLYSVGFHHNWCDKNIQADPEELLGWIRHADLVITDTFHGTVMSLICNTPMIVRVRENRNKLVCLLEEYELTDRIVPGFAELDRVYEKTVDFDRVNTHIQKNRSASRAFLSSAAERQS